MRRITNSQRQAVKKYLCLAFSVLFFLGTLASIPRLVSIIPNLNSETAKKLIYGTDVMADTPTFALGNGDISTPPREEPNESMPDESPPNQDQNSTETPIPMPIPNEGDLFVTPNNLCWYEIGETPGLNIIDRTSYNADLQSFIQRDFPINGEITNDPLVLIIHTHGSESYLPAGQNFYSPNEDFRSQNPAETVVHIGEILCEQLNSLGIPTIQDKTMHDIPDYNQSYNNSLKAIKQILAQNPTIKFVIDLHRDSVFDSAGNNIKPLTNINNEDCAQLMLVVGTDEMGISHPSWRNNLTFATYLQQKTNELYPTLMRPINLRTAEFNQAQTKGSIILEVGSCGNTVQEAENAITLFANSYAELLKEYLL